MSVSRRPITLNAHFDFGQTESFNLWVSSSRTQAGRKAFADALGLDVEALGMASKDAPTPVGSLVPSALMALETAVRLKLETLADMIKRARSRAGTVSLTAFQE